MLQPRKSLGFSLIELLLVLAILGIISGFAIPTFLGQRRRARMIGDAQANAQILRMMLEQRKAENGIFGATGTYTWTAAGTTPSASTNIAPAFTPRGNSKMDYAVAVGSTGLTYGITVRDATLAGSPPMWVVDQAGNGHIASGYNY